MSDDDAGHESFEEKLRAIARELSESVERAAGQIDLDEIAEAIGISAERAREFADFAGRWLSGRFEDVPEEPPAQEAQSEPAVGEDWLLDSHGPHPLDLPTEEQGLALSALDSGRWKVEPGTNVLIAEGQGPSPSNAMGLVGELRARDWIAAGGEVTLVGRDALRRWLDSAKSK
jgi:hypothetical protein